MTTNGIVQKIWNFCHTLRDDGVGYGDYLEQITYLLFLKMAHEYSQEPYNRKTNIPELYNWDSLVERSGADLEQHYVTLLRELGKESGMLGQIFVKSQNKIQDPAKLYKRVEGVRMSLNKKFYTNAEACRKLNLSQDIFTAIGNSGLLGYCKNDDIPAIAVEHFGLYGTQWRSDLGVRSAKSGMQSAQNSFTDKLHPGTIIESCIAPKDISTELSENEKKWIAQFYIRPNKFYFADPFSLALNGPTSIILEKKVEISGTSLQCFLCPDPQGMLAMVMVFGTDSPNLKMWESALDVVNPVLDEISFKYDQPLPIAHSLIVGVPSGICYTYQFALPNEGTISSGSEIKL